MLILFSLLHAENIFVSNAFEIAAAMNTAQPGDSLIMRQGVWTDQRIIFEGNGEENKPIVLKAERPGFVILNGIEFFTGNLQIDHGG